MGLGAKSRGFSFLFLLRSAAMRIGLYTGLALSLLFTAWLLVANRMPAFDAVSVPRNVIAASLLAVVGALPVLRFLRSPAEMLLSSVVAWCFFTLTYGILCLAFSMLDQYYSTFQVFVLGSVIYLLLATLSWIGTIIWRVRASSHPRH
jgi:hypothetical protein